MSRLPTTIDPNRKKEYWEDDFNTLKDEFANRPKEKLPKGNLRIGKQVGAILSSMLDGKGEYEDVFRETGMGRPSFRLALQGAKRSDMVTADGKLTQLGRWCAIAFRIGVGFIEVCALADMYFFRSLCRNSTNRYPKYDALEVALGLTNQQISRAYHRLAAKEHVRCRNGIECKFNPNVLYLDDGLFLLLHEYMEDMIILKRAL